MSFAERVALRNKREAYFQQEFLDDFRFWVETVRKIALRLFDLIVAILRDDFSGIGKPEPLKYLPYNGAWSRRLTQEHRVVDSVTNDRVNFIQAHYRH